MLRLIVVGTLFAVLIYGPLLFHVVRSRRRLYATRISAGRNATFLQQMRMLLPQILVTGFVWSVILYFTVPLSVLVFFNPSEEYRDLTSVITTVIFIPISIFENVMSLVLGTQSNAPFQAVVFWLLLPYAICILLLLSASEWLLLRFPRRGQRHAQAREG